MHLQLHFFGEYVKKYISVHEYGNACNYIKIDVDVCVSMCFCKASKPAMTEKFWAPLEFPCL